MISEEAGATSEAGKQAVPWWRHPAIWASVLVTLLGVASMLYLRADDDPPSSADLDLELTPGEILEGLDPIQAMNVAEEKIVFLTYPDTDSSSGKKGRVEALENLSLFIWRLGKPDPPRPWPGEEARLYLQRHASAIAQFMEAADLPARHWDFGVELTPDYVTPGVEWYRVWQAIAVLTLERLDQGEWDAAMEGPRVVLHLGNVIAERVPTIFGALLASTWWYRGRQLGIELATHERIPPEKVVELARLMHSLEPSTQWLVRAWQGECHIGQAILADRDRWAQFPESPWADEKGNPAPLDALEELLFNENRTHAALLDFYRGQIESVRAFKPLPPRAEKFSFLWKNRTGRRLLQLMLSEGYEEMGPGLLASHAEARASTIRVALLAYHAQHDGKLPRRLGDLSPAILPTLPLDPFTGRDFGYLPDPGWIYSLGRDRKDSGGLVGTERFDDNLHGETNDDLTMVVLPPVPEPEKPRSRRSLRGSRTAP